MIIFKEVGGVQVFGKNADKWEQEEHRFIAGVPAVFDSDVYKPGVSQCKKKHFELPCHRGQTDYKIHLLETGDALILKEGRAFFCTRNAEVPVVLTLDPVPADRIVAQAV